MNNRKRMAEQIASYYMKNPSSSSRTIGNYLKCDPSYCRRIMRQYNRGLFDYLKPKNLKPNMPKILLFDLETAPMLCLAWQPKTEYINNEFILKDISILSWAAKWLYDDKIMSGTVSYLDAKERRDGSACKSLWKLLDTADVVIGHNVKDFDNRIANTRFIINGLKPPSSYKSIDTCLIAKSKFKFTSNRLNYIAQILCNKEKIHTNAELWKKCISGKKDIATKALKYMTKYNMQDVRILEDVYLQLRSWDSYHHNLAIYGDMKGKQCPVCGSKNIKQKKQYYTASGRYDSYVCNKCGSLSRSRYSNLSKEERKELLTIAVRQ